MLSRTPHAPHSAPTEPTNPLTANATANPTACSRHRYAPFRTARIRLGGSLGLLATAASLIAEPVGANVTVNEWTGPNNFHHRRTGMPDQDQRRDGLPNFGSCYCVPTSHLNMLMYIANHGHPDVPPGPGNWSGPETYDNVTEMLDQFGALMNVSPGGDDPNDPDCTGGESGGGSGGDGQCDSLGCGTGLDSAYDALLDVLGSSSNDFLITASFMDTTWTPSFEVIGALGYLGYTVAFCYGRYDVVGGDTNGVDIIRRDGGHCVTMTEILADGTNRKLYVRDPSEDESPDDLFGPSTYATKEYDVTPLYLAVTTDEGGLLQNWTYKTLDALDEPHSDGRYRLLDSYLAIAPKSGFTWNPPGFTELNLGTGIGGSNPLGELGGPDDPINDCTPGTFPNIMFVVTNTGTEAVVHAVDILTDETTPIGTVPGSGGRIATSRFGDLYAMAGQRLHRYDGNASTLLNIAALPSGLGTARAMTYDDSTDQLLVLFVESAGGGTILAYPRSLGNEVEPIVAYEVSADVIFGGGEVQLSVRPRANQVWTSSETSGEAIGFKLNAKTLEAVKVDSLAAPGATSVDFDDSGTLYLVANNTCLIYRQDEAGQWNSQDNSVFDGYEIGNVVRLRRSRTNFDPAIHDTQAWNSLTTEDLLDIGTTIPDCRGDVNLDGEVDLDDLLVVLASWGTICNNDCIADIDRSGEVGLDDLLILLAAWGAC